MYSKLLISRYAIDSYVFKYKLLLRRKLNESSFVLFCIMFFVQPWYPNRRTHRAVSVVCLNRLLFSSTEVKDLHVKLPLSDHRAAHVRDVLRLSTGGRVRAGVLNDALYDDVHVTVGAEHVTFALDGEAKRRDLPAPPAISLMLAMPRPKVLARLLPQIAALGVQHLALVNAYRVERFYFDSALLRDPSAVRASLVQGLMQAGNDARIPDVHIGLRLRVFLEDEMHRIAPHGAMRIVAHPAGSVSVLNRLANSTPDIPSHVLLAVGPEGGWMPRELTMLEKQSFQTVSLGNRILRTDTAVLVLLGLIAECQRTSFHDAHKNVNGSTNSTVSNDEKDTCL